VTAANMSAIDLLSQARDLLEDVSNLNTNQPDEWAGWERARDEVVAAADVLLAVPESNADGLLPCPWCDDKRPNYINNTEPVVCVRCHARGPHTSSTRHHWNQRHTPAADGGLHAAARALQAAVDARRAIGRLADEAREDDASDRPVHWRELCGCMEDEFESFDEMCPQRTLADLAPAPVEQAKPADPAPEAAPAEDCVDAKRLPFVDEAYERPRSPAESEADEIKRALDSANAPTLVDAGSMFAAHGSQVQRLTTAGRIMALGDIAKQHAVLVRAVKELALSSFDAASALREEAHSGRCVRQSAESKLARAQVLSSHARRLKKMISGEGVPPETLPPVDAAEVKDD